MNATRDARTRARTCAGCSFAVGAIVGLLMGSPVFAQDFALGPAPAMTPAAHALLEHGFASLRHGARVETGLVRWHGLPELTARSLAVAGSWRALRVALGVSQTGDHEIGWSALGAAAGAAGPTAGAALRLVTRHDRANATAPGPLGAGLGMEAGGGAWAEAAPGFVVWAFAPQIWTRGVAPPLARALEIGARLEGGGLGAWIARASPGASGTPAGGHRAGVTLDAGAWGLWLESRDRPLRAGFGLVARFGPTRLAVGVEGHPVLDETVRVAVGVGAR